MANNIDWHKIYRKYENGISLRQIAKQIDCSRQTIKKNFQKLGYVIKTRKEVMTGINHFNWNKLGKYKCKRGYICIRENKKWKREHIIVWEQHHKKKIPKGYEVHHKDFNKSNNRIENLQLLISKEHKSLHMKYTMNRR